MNPLSNLSPIDRLAEWLIRTLRERHEKDGFIRKILSIIRPGLLIVSLLYLFGIVALCVLLRWQGEQVPVLGFILYFPQQFWLLPALVMAPISVCFRPVLGLVYAACFLLVVIVLMGFRWAPHAAAPTHAAISVVTNNRGQDNGNSLMPFVGGENPDFLVCQEDGRAGAFARIYPDRSCVSYGEFTLVSKYPITDSGFVPSPTWQGVPVAAWYVVDFHGKPIVIYSVHLPTPRNELYKLRGPGLLAATLPLPGSRFASFRERTQQIWRDRVQVAKELADVLAKEQRPFIAAGDFNMPRPGFNHSLFSANLLDSFEECGRGFGFTMPGVTRNPLSLYGPWMRIDYIFSNHRLRPFYVRTELHRHSQHRAVSAKFELIEESGSPATPSDERVDLPSQRLLPTACAN